MGLLGDLLPELAAFIDMDGGKDSDTWKYLAVLDRYEKAMKERGIEVSNALRTAVLMAAYSRTCGARSAVGVMSAHLKIPRVVYFSAVAIIESEKRLKSSPAKGRRKFVYGADFADMLDYGRIVARAEGASEATLDEWEALGREVSVSKTKRQTQGPDEAEPQTQRTTRQRRQ